MFDSESSPQKDPAEAGDPVATEMQRRARVEALDQEIGEAFGSIAAAEARLCSALAEFEEAEGWQHQGAASFEEWLFWRGGAGRRVAGDYVALARRLGELPHVKRSFSKGEISLSKARAICRIATPGTEEMLVSWARSVTGADMERIARTWNKMRSDEELREARAKRDARECSWYVGEDGMMSLKARLLAEDGALVARAIEQAADQDMAEEGAAAEERTWSQRRADALVQVAERSLAAGGAELKDRYLATVHIDLDVLTEDNPEGRCEIFPGAGIHRESAARLLCCSPIISLLYRDGGPIDVGRKTRAISARMRRALEARDHTCRYPRCSRRVRLEGHHVAEWVADLGPTDLVNLCLLCPYHHWLVHEGGFKIERKKDDFVFYDRFGKVIPNAPPPLKAGTNLKEQNRALGLAIDDQTIIPPHYDGRAPDMDQVIYVLDQEMRAEGA